MYEATRRDKRGHVLDSAFGGTREVAARILFGAYPTCQEVQVCNAYLDAAGCWHGNGSDIRWVKRRDLDTPN